MFMVRAINAEGYQDNVLALAILAAALTPILRSLRAPSLTHEARRLDRKRLSRLGERPIRPRRPRP